MLPTARIAGLLRGSEAVKWVSSRVNSRCRDVGGMVNSDTVNAKAAGIDLNFARRSYSSGSHKFGAQLPAIIVNSKSEDIYFNLSLERILFETFQPSVPVFFWWRNSNTVVIGRHQNPWQECKVDKMNADGTKIARRFTGGGAVYQDLGNSCFTFIGHHGCGFSKDRNNKIILDVLREHFGIAGVSSGRNDLVVASSGKKFSGAAFKVLNVTRNPADENAGIAGPRHPLQLHHGTVLINTDLTALKRYLSPSKIKLQSKGVQSVESRVENLADLNSSVSHEALFPYLATAFLNEYTSTDWTFERAIERQLIHTVSSLSDGERFGSTVAEELSAVHRQLSDWDWNYGKTHPFKHNFEMRFDWGTITVHADVESGTIARCRVFTDALNIHLAPYVEAALTGCCYSSAGVLNALRADRSSQETHSKSPLPLLVDLEPHQLDELRHALAHEVER